MLKIIKIVLKNLIYNIIKNNIKISTLYYCKMELTLEPELYCPSVDELGNYIDKVPCITRGIKCPCNSRPGKIYQNHSVFASHIKTKVHQNWL